MYQVINKETGKEELLENFVYFRNKDKYTTDLKWKKAVPKKRKVTKKITKKD